ncbi:DUF3168 domain-containing protein [Rhizobium sp. Root483D2]|uniref:DUF3168 domain-containing protein n=1 Tax=Rhizobium sp. Root483D2 TaxID=1736545 RepID=UPI0007139E35|nr:DUF3168 domain-containing protein [Rhizobium sp. Root483D2]KQY31802.1 hypothetical protein ASD32_04205 [Rhizobium sp. Root483D2]
MTEDVSHELQVAIVDRLKGFADLVALIDDRVFDWVPRNVSGEVTAAFPFVSFGPEQDIPEDADCIDASEIVIQIDAWSRDPGYREVRRVAKGVISALDNASLPLADNALVYFAYDGRRVLRDPDGLTSHAVLTFRAGVERH